MSVAPEDITPGTGIPDMPGRWVYNFVNGEYVVNVDMHEDGSLWWWYDEVVPIPIHERDGRWMGRYEGGGG